MYIVIFGGEFSERRGSLVRSSRHAPRLMPKLSDRGIGKHHGIRGPGKDDVQQFRADKQRFYEQFYEHNYQP
ncbi:hypothetical protein NDU88_007741 [Pleurodeles waltl]|uniref:Uncharacterized protein n=1 Tax=Pleurodeles waltl TaxID=8319 RepID=A0AAV7N6R5_PLEWA|nr:hypothetical protein NDU88_007741 [Pleurodeles waltl]